MSIKISQKIAKTLTKSRWQTAKYKNIVKHFLTKPNPIFIFLSKVTPNQALEIIGHLKSKKSPDIDNIPNSQSRNHC